MRYIGGVVTVVAIVFPFVIIYKLWNTKRDSNINKQLDSSIVSEGSENINITLETNPTTPFGTSSSMFEYGDSTDNIHITITQQPHTTSPSISHSENSNNDNDNSITPQLDSTFDLETPSVMSHSVDSTNSLSLPPVEYEVFLSFRGPDTRSQITEILYRFLVHSKIHTFKDDDEMRKGEGIWPTLVKAINQSKVYVPILSENYAHSKWCLNELVEIVESWTRDNRHIILPIFYMVDPRDVRHQSGPYQEAFEQHEKRFDPLIIQTWKNALKKIGDLKGWHVKNNNEQVAISDNVSEIIWSHISKSNGLLDNTVEFIGIDDHVQAVVETLSLDSDEGTIMVGIHGSGGIGKTTLATAVYNKISTRFDRCCFLENIRETQQHKDGILTLQKKLISNVLRKNVGEINDANEGRKIIRERVSQFKVLVVLDDVDNTFKFDDIFGNAGNFIQGSRFIATSRDISVLRSLNEDQCRLYEVTVLDHDRSLQLFCKNAFRKNSPPPEFDALSHDIVSTTGGLPLTLKVVGSLLYREEVNIWKEKLAQLRETTEKEEASRLKVLDLSSCKQLKEVPELPKSGSIEILYLSYFGASSLSSGELNIGNLSNLIVLRINDSCIKKIKGGTIEMVSRLRELNVSRSNCENLREVLVDVEKLTCLEILRANVDKMDDENNKVLVGRILPTSLKELNISSQVPNLLEMFELEMLFVEYCHDVLDIIPNDKWWKLSKLTSLTLRYTKIVHLPMSYNLSRLHMYECEVSEFSPNLACLENLTELHVEDCHNLREIQGLGGLKSLITLYIWGSKCLTHLDIAGLLSFNKVRELTISSCPLLTSLITCNGTSTSTIACDQPVIVVDSLEKLHISDCSSLELVGNVLPYLAKFPRLKDLQLMNLIGGCEILTLPTCLEELVSLALFTMSSMQVIKFSSKLRKLTYLTICHFQGLREIEELSECRSLKYIHLSYCPSLEKLPSLQNLSKLEELILVHLTSLREIGKNDIAGLKCLENLSLYGCETLERLPIDELSGLEKLKYLNLQKCTELSIDDIFAIKTRLPNVQYSTDNMVGLILKNRVSTLLKQWRS
ncbi:Disease resistance protein L6 [Linum perenne]